MFTREPTAHPNSSAGSCLAAALGHHVVVLRSSLGNDPIGEPSDDPERRQGPANPETVTVPAPSGMTLRLVSGRYWVQTRDTTRQQDKLRHRRTDPPARQQICELLKQVLAGDINPGIVFDYTTDLNHVADAHAAMEERRAIESLLTVSQP
jgi:hypothetical protein